MQIVKTLTTTKRQVCCQLLQITYTINAFTLLIPDRQGNRRGKFKLWNISSVTQLCPTLCDPMDYTMPGLPVHHQLPEPTQTNVHRILCHPLLLPPSIFPSTRVFSSESVLRIRWSKYWVSASASVLPMNIQDWLPLWWTGWISLQSKGLSRVFSNTTVQKHQFFGTQLSYSPTLTSIPDYWKNHSFD